MLKEIIIFFVILLSIPLGNLIAWMGRDELIVGRKWFKLMLYLCIFGLGLFLALGNYVISIVFICIFIITYISLKKSFDKKLTSKRIG